MKHVFITDDLREYAEKFLRDNYGIDPIEIRANGRFRRTLGQYVREYNVDPNSDEPEFKHIELAKDVLRYGHPDVVRDILRHELIHYALQTLGRPYLDGTEEFESELRRHNSASTGDITLGVVTIYRCGQCGEELLHRRDKIPEVNLHRYKSQCCSAEITFIESRVYDGRNHEYVTR